MPNLRGASPVGRGDGGLLYAARSVSKAIHEVVVGVDEVGVARYVTRVVDSCAEIAYKHVQAGGLVLKIEIYPKWRDFKNERRGDGSALRLMGRERSSSR